MSQQPIPDAHTSIFTQIPQTITKTWSTKTVSAITCDPVDKIGLKHCDAMITSISLEVNFNPMLVDEDPILNENADAGSSLISVWQEARRDWASLEAALTTTISEFNERINNRCKETRVSTVDLMTKTSTQYRIKKRNSSNTNPRMTSETNEWDGVRVMNENCNRTGNVMTIKPDDSMSNIDLKDLQNALSQLSLKKPGLRHKKRSAKSISIMRAMTT